MVRRVEDFISTNNRGVGRLEGYYVGATESRAIDLSFSGNNCTVRVSGTMYERGRGDNLLIGSSEPEHGIGRGELGTSYGDWERLIDEPVDGLFSVDGRETVVDSLRGIENGIHYLAVGTGESPPSRSDEALEEERDRRRAWTYDTGRHEVTTGRQFSSILLSEVSEVGVLDREDRLMGRTVFGSETDLPGVHDYRVELTLEFESQTIGAGYITDIGLEAIADSVSRSEEVVGIDHAVIGTSAAAPAPSDTDLDARLDAKPVERRHRSDTVAATTVWFEDEPAGHPHTLQEIGLEDNQGRLIWRTVFDTEEKTDDLPFIVDVRIRII